MRSRQRFEITPRDDTKVIIVEVPTDKEINAYYDGWQQRIERDKHLIGGEKYKQNTDAIARLKKECTEGRDEIQALMEGRAA